MERAESVTLFWSRGGEGGPCPTPWSVPPHLPYLQILESLLRIPVAGEVGRQVGQTWGESQERRRGTVRGFSCDCRGGEEVLLSNVPDPIYKALHVLPHVTLATNLERQVLSLPASYSTEDTGAQSSSAAYPKSHMA